MTGTQAKSFPTVRIGGLETAVVSRAELARLMLADVRTAHTSDAKPLPKLVFSSNGQGISLAAANPAFRRAMAAADVIHADGMSVVFASRLLTCLPLPERVATTDFFNDAAAAAQAEGHSFFLLGGRDEQNKAACAAACRMYPDLRIAGRHHGYFSADQSTDICRTVVESGADVLWLALGKPKQEFWAIEHRERLRGVAWVKTCGGLYSFLAGDAPRAPRWAQDLGLEWVHRMLHDPSRLGLRYLTTNPHAMWRMLVDSDRGTLQPW